MKLDRATIERLVPQTGTMCLLDAVSQWNAGSIVCTADAPGSDHPLARDEHVPAIASCEYAAQAAAIHGALIEHALAPRAGMLAKLMDIELHAPGFPAGEPVRVRAEMLSRVAAGCLYSFQVSAGESPVCDGRLMVVFGAPA
ncbi:hydroxymyristoyl-ACP dehydratase [Ramlibacter sp. PS4R-6]|uniref:hydroxymyristoyl-ACP dehydratase n=1 Tax=Ramlibacter sp. PS4R-6 TaxID=3133438 RepID=UPI0030AF53C3